MLEEKMLDGDLSLCDEVEEDFSAPQSDEPDLQGETEEIPKESVPPDEGEKAEEIGTDSENDELTLLRKEVELLRSSLRSREELDRANERMRNELSEFSEYFPQVELSEIPDEIWEKVKKGDSLSSAYALHLRKKELAEQRADDFNKKNRRMSTGSLQNGEGEKYFSPSEVRRMTQKQVRQNYDEIVESMRHWN
ncbi:MAG: hypothetical protein ACI3XL_00660 [Eubacteriales bacterium]